VAPLPDSVIGRLAAADATDTGDADVIDMPVVAPGAPLRPMSRSSVCSAVASAARANDLPVPFFANLIWQESSFNPRTVSPAGAQGIAQFMPETAKEYGLTNPFDPIHALSAAGRFLNKLVAQFGNLGLAAAAYNAGPGRVNAFVSKRRQLPDETKNYVVRITGRSAEKWASRASAGTPEAKLMPAKAPCVEVAEEVAAQAKAVHLARLAAPAVAAPGRQTTARMRAALTRVRTAVTQIKAKTAGLLGAKKPAAAPVKLAARIVPAKNADRVGEPVSQTRGKASDSKTSVSKASVNKTVAAKTAPKPGLASTKRTRVASAR
jgi:hypothetical protein